MKIVLLDSSMCLKPLQVHVVSLTTVDANCTVAIVSHISSWKDAFCNVLLPSSTVHR